MKSLAIFLLAYTGKLSAIRLNGQSNFIIEENELENYDYVVDHQGNLQELHIPNSLIQSRAQSDPIYPSTGLEKMKSDSTPSSKLEADLRERKPQEFKDDPESHQDTQSSISWAEKNLKTEFKLPKFSDDEKKLRKAEVIDPDSNIWDDDDDIKSTLKSAH